MDFASHFHLETVGLVLLRLESGDLRASPWRQRLTHPSGPWLRINLTVYLRHLAMESTVKVGIFFGGVIVIPQLG
jgi:hypothetical protein